MSSRRKVLQWNYFIEERFSGGAQWRVFGNTKRNVGSEVLPVPVERPEFRGNDVTWLGRGP